MQTQPVWYEEGRVKIIDQTRLPAEYVVMEVDSPAVMFEAIRTLQVRGAPAIGIAAGFGVWLGVAGQAFTGREAFLSAVDSTAQYLCGARPTAVNLFWAARRMQQAARSLTWADASTAADVLLAEAQSILAEDVQSCRSIGLYGAEVLRGCKALLTHCNAGGLATSGYGTALAPVYVLQEQGQAPHVYADETRPLLQGARLTAWELSQAGVPVTVQCDNMAAVLMQQGKVEAVIIGADRIAKNGDAANKIGSYGLSVLAKAHGLPFYVAAPFSTVDFDCESGAAIPIEMRGAEEVRFCGGARTAPQEAEVFNPAFDVVPQENITAIFTEKGVVRAPFGPSLRQTFEEGRLFAE